MERNKRKMRLSNCRTISHCLHIKSSLLTPRIRQKLGDKLQKEKKNEYQNEGGEVCNSGDRSETLIFSPEAP